MAELLFPGANMPQIKQILCPVDFSEPSARAYGSAQSLARHYQAKLFLQHVVDFKLPTYAYYGIPPKPRDFQLVATSGKNQRQGANSNQRARKNDQH
jgi:hypothetical protein